MTDLHGALARLSRPRLLIRAARFGMAEYRRSARLRRALFAAGAHTPAQVVTHLMRREAEMDQQRRAGDAGYSVARHVDALIALMAEAQLLPDTPPAPRRAGSDPRTVARPATRADRPAQAKLSGISALRRATNASSASRHAGSSAGGS